LPGRTSGQRSACWSLIRRPVADHRC
jgi:hypothetical protein